ncbi:hypothetical protein TrLO_g4701 [Triparma laevis f. longispina]|uniref:J domain-containing protein n=1 Tax=Triparma laevis f. longispina TaxID=1714387 RepID=A0A9W7DPD8_9STRA|nr:hypothetical protein TrLO_g4701 [Triparma laevis f. longispina]
MPSESFYEYYTLLGMPLPSSASWLSAPSSSYAPTPTLSKKPTPIAPEAVKKLYRKASLKHHPDRGGDPGQFIKLKRAAKVLGDEGLRLRYDILGIDSELDDCATNPTSPSDSGSGDETPSDNNTATKLQELSGVISASLVSIFLRTLCVYAVIFFIKYKYVNLAATMGIWFVAGFKLPGVEKNIKLMVAATPLLIWVVWYSTAGGWIFWLFESTCLSMIVLLGLDPPFNRYVLCGVCGMGLALGWWFHGGFWCYLSIVCIEIFLGLVCLLVFPLCESLVKEAVDGALKVYAEKMKTALEKQREVDRKSYGK